MSIIVATDFSDNARRALHAAAYLAQTRNVELDVVHCLEWQTELSDDEIPDEQSFSEYLDDVLAELKSHVDETLAGGELPDQLNYEVFAGTAESEIVDAIETDGHELAVLGATGQGRIETFLLGSLPEAVVRRSSAPVLVVPPEIEAGGYHEIVAPVDLTPCSRKSLEYAGRMARDHGAQLTILYAAPITAKMGPTPIPPSAPAQSEEDFESQAEKRLEDFAADVSLEGLDPNLRIETGSPRDAIEEAVEDLDADLIVMGTHGKRGAERLFLGSTASNVLRRMPCSVMTLRHRDDSDD